MIEMKSIIIKNTIYKNVNRRRHVKVLWPEEEGEIYFYLEMNGKGTVRKFEQSKRD